MKDQSMEGGILIANRGEIAVRVIRSCREMGIRAVAVYSTADRDALHGKMADQAVCIGPPPAQDSYLNRSALISAALYSGCDAIHPGVGFLSENASFCRQVRDSGLTFIGADPDVIDLLGDKVKAKRSAAAAGIPLIPGSEGAVPPGAGAIATAREVGFPLIIKAASGGGGKGMRIVRDVSELEKNLTLASSEALKSFADGTVYLERYLENPRHVELQIMADGMGNVCVLGERDCSVQKNHQKLLEESPSPGVSTAMHKAMASDAMKLFKNLEYAGAGTIEFLVVKGEYFFMEVNARIQVEHPVTEMICGYDLIRQQILIAMAHRMECPNGDLMTMAADCQQGISVPGGYALECRINALTPGKVSAFIPPGGPEVRTDSFLYPGCTVPPNYDSLVAKVIVHARTRAEGLKRMARALSELVIEGIKVNTASQLAILSSKKFASGDFGTGLYESLSKELPNG
jgi:acetyl-CoA carboxylase, biotin carboxylase subunit